MKLLKYILVALVFVVTTGEAFGQVKVLSGKVSEMFGSTADPLMGVNINVMNSQNRSLGGTVSNVDGIYNLKIPAGEKNLTIVFSYIGMKTKRIKYTGQEKLNVTLQEDTRTIDQVVIEGKRIERNELGITAREQTSATQKVQMSDLVDIAPITTIEDALARAVGWCGCCVGRWRPGCTC